MLDADAMTRRSDAALEELEALASGDDSGPVAVDAGRRVLDASSDEW
ncbi:antitoxin [Cellulomonas xylanilytica]|nr:antitoxin [Cellulomonas xylanilytica]